MKSDQKDILSKSIRTLKGIGESRARLFRRLGVNTIEDVITYFPRDYEDRSNIKKICELLDSELCTFEGVIASKVSESRPRRGLTIYKVIIKDETGSATGTWFNQRYIKNAFEQGKTYVFYGKVSKKYGKLEVQAPAYEEADADKAKSACRIIPVYPSTAGLSQKVIRSVIKCALELVVGNIEEILPQTLRNRYHLSEINYSISNIHFPKSVEDFNRARHRLAFEEFILLQLGLFSTKISLVENKKGVHFRKVKEMDDFIQNLPFKLTRAQKKVFEEIETDMESNRIMNRLVQGDVGSGKTAVAVLALFKAVKCGYQGTLMVPTEILAEQHYKSVTALLDTYGINVGLLTGRQSKKQKAEVLENIRTGQLDIVIGTHALIEEDVEFYRLGLVITDEQHRFGVRQRAVLSQKGNNPDILVMSATPIPRTLALIVYGDLDISIIDELPQGRKPIETYVVDNGMRERINNFIRKEVTEGRQVYIVCPLVEESDAIEAKSAMELAEEIAKRDFSDLNVGLVHGKMKGKDKDEIMEEFVAGQINILVSTTVIEVGVNVPNATVMIIENAERFGLAQLHQLRGRVGRGERQSYCILYNESNSNVSRERMDIMRKTNDGFIISEKDMQLRGTGEFFGTRQHGIPDLKIANIYKDMDILRSAQDAAREIIQRDRNLEQDENKKLKEVILRKFDTTLKDISMN